LLVRACIEKGIRVECLPGATAFVPALVTSGLPCDAFVFDGFLPHKKGRMKKLEHLKSIGKTIVLYESPHRLMKLLGELKEYFDDDTPVVVSREISKKFEETIRGTAAELEQHFTTKPPKGEFVVVIGSK
jgi:16S rRNA (cytidine1402-2'-O)-methyltransferase